MTGKQGHWMPFYWSDYFGKTTHLSCEEHGAYMLLLGAYWQRGKPLPDDDAYLSTASRLSRKRWRFVRPKVSEFFDLSGGAWRHDRVEIELLKSCQRIAAASANAYARWDADSMLPTPTKKEDSDSFNVGRKKRAGNGCTIKDPAERLNRFQRSLAEAMGQDGYKIVGAAADPGNPFHARSLALCKAKAKEMGKGWPLLWPVP